MSQTREQLQAEISTLTAERDELNVKLLNAASTPEYNAFQDQIKRKDEAINLKNEQLERIAVAAETAQAEVFNQFDQLTFGSGEDQVVLSLRDLCKDEGRYQLVSQFIQTVVGDMAQTHAAIDSSNESRIAMLEEQNKELETLRAENMRLADKAADLEAKRDAAGAQIAELEEEVNRLTEDNDALRTQLKQMATRPGAVTAGIDQLALAKQIKAEEEAAKPGYYNKRWSTKENGMEDRRFFTITLSATGEDINVPQLEIGKYREESAEDAARFRQAEEERKAKEALDLASENAVAPSLTEDTFPEEEENGAVQADSVPGAVANEDSEVLRRLERLERAVFGEVKDVA